MYSECQFVYVNDIVECQFFLRLTAFVVKSFSRAMPYIYIDGKSLNKSVDFILSTQQKDGSFKETGSVSSYLQVGNSHLIYCSYIKILLLYIMFFPSYQNKVHPGIKFIVINICFVWK